MSKSIQVTGVDIRAAEGTAMRRMAWALVFVLASGPTFGATRPETAKKPQGAAVAATDLTAWETIAAGVLEQLPVFVSAPSDPDAPKPDAIGLAPQAWRGRLAELAGTRQGDVAPGVDLFLSGDGERLVAVLLVKPGADVSSVPLALPEGAQVERGPQGHVIVRLAGGDLALLRPGIVQRQDGELVAVHGGWASSPAGIELALGKFDGSQALYVRFELLSLSSPKQLERFDHNHDGSVEMQELRPVVTAPPPVPDAPTMTATQADAFTVDTDGDTQADPGDVIRYTVVISAAVEPATALTFNDTPDIDTTLVGGSINVSPLARDDTYGAAGNVTLTVNSVPAGLFANDNDFLADTFTLTNPAPNVATPTTGGGSITIQADGTFSYTTPPGQSTGTDTFVYTLTDTGGLTGTGTVTFNISGTVWFVDRDAAGGGTGTQANPFNVLSPTTVAGAGGAGDVDGPNDIIYLYDRAAATDYTGGLQLEAGQRLVGSGVPLIVGGTTILAATTPPVLVNTGGNALTLIAGATVDARPHVEGVTVAAANNSAVFGTGALGTLSLDTVTLSTSGTGAGVTLTNQTGSLTISNGSITGTGTGAALALTTGIGSVDLTGATINKTAGPLVNVSNKTGGTVIFGGVTGTGAAADSIVVQTNTGTTLNFTSGLSVATTAGRGLFANGGGTINVAGTSSTIAATGGAALDVNSTSFGAGLTLASASSTSSTAEGLRLSNVTGPVTINGGAISGSTGTAFSLTQGSAAMTYAGTISKTNAGRAVDVQTRGGGTATFSGAITATGASTGINVSGATAISTVAFTGAVDLGTSGTRLTGGTALTVNHNANASTTSFTDLDVFTTGQAGINASNGGTFNLTTGQVDAGGRALNLDGLAAGATFTSLISAGSTAEGVRLNAITGSVTTTSTAVTNPATQGISVAASSANITFASGAGTTTVSGSGTQRLLVGSSTGTVAFHNTTLNGGSDGVSLQNNSAGLRTFGALTIGNTTPVAGTGLLHSVGGGDLTVSGTTTITNPGGPAIDVEGAGAGHDLSFFTLFVTKAAGTAVTFGTAVTNSATSTIEFNQVSLTTSNGTAIQAGSATTTTPLGIHNSSSINATGGAAVNAQGTAFNASTFNSVSSTNSAIQGLNLVNCTGSLNLGATASITGAAGTAVNVDGGSLTVSYGGAVTQNNAQRVVQVQNTTGGSVTLGGAVTGGASSTGVNINAANGGVTFGSLTLGTSGSRTANQAVTINGGTGTYSLGPVSIFTTGGGAKGISAVNADGTLNVPSGTVDTTTAAAIDIDGPAGLTTLGLTLTTVNVNGAANGISVREADGSFTVAGTGAAGSGGTIQNITNRGAAFINATNISLSRMNFTNANTTDGATSDGVPGGNENTDENGALHFDSVVQVDLTGLVINGTAQHGINGNNVTDLDITDTTITNTGNEVWESGIYLFDLKGLPSLNRTNIFSNVDISLSGQFNLAIFNEVGTNDPGPSATSEKDRLEIINDCDFATSGQAVIGDHVTIFNSGTTPGSGNFQVVVTGASFTSATNCPPPSGISACTSDGIQVDAGNDAAFDVQISGGAYTSAGQAGINLSASGNGRGTFSVNGNNPVSVRASVGVNVSLASANDIAFLKGPIANNSIATSVANNAGFGIGMIANDEGSLVVDVNNNAIAGNGTLDFDYGIRGGSRAEDSNADFTINNNTITSAEVAGVWFFSGNGTAGETSDTCVNFISNLFDGDPVDSFTDYFVEMYTGTTFRLHGLTGSGTNLANVHSFIAATDDDPSPTDPTVDAGSGTAVNYNSATCVTP